MRLPVYIKREGSEERLVNNEKPVDPNFYKRRRRTWNVPATLRPAAYVRVRVCFSLVKMMRNLGKTFVLQGIRSLDCDCGQNYHLFFFYSRFGRGKKTLAGILGIKKQFRLPGCGVGGGVIWNRGAVSQARMAGVSLLETVTNSASIFRERAGRICSLIKLAGGGRNCLFHPRRQKSILRNNIVTCQGEKGEKKKKVWIDCKAHGHPHRSPPLPRDSVLATGSWASLRLHTDKEMAAHPRQQKRGWIHAGLWAERSGAHFVPLSRILNDTTCSRQSGVFWSLFSAPHSRLDDGKIKGKLKEFRRSSHWGFSY